MSWWIKGVRCNSFRHHFLQCHAICLVSTLLVCWIQDHWSEVSNVFSFVKCEVFICVIRDKYVNKCLAFDLVNAMNYVNVWVLSFGSTVICKEVCHMCCNNRSTDLDWDHTIVSEWYLESYYRSVYKLEIYHSVVYNNFVPSIR